jgi:hypothetical protein
MSAPGPEIPTGLHQAVPVFNCPPCGFPASRHADNDHRGLDAVVDDQPANRVDNLGA